MINEFNKTNLKALRADIDAALAEVNKKHGVNLNIGNISYSEAEFTAKFKGTVTNTEVLSDHKKSEFTTLAFSYGLKPSDYGRTFKQNGKTFTVAGIKTRNSRYPIVCDASDGKSYKFAEESVKRLLAK